jgi:aryl-alcohol dehydrogenase-like predicted oxidoreductase
MKKVSLPHTNVETSRLGFGSVRLTVQRNRREALAVLEQAFSLGITHFDTARAYGFGRAEGILRDFLRQKRGAVTITTKFGIEPPSGLAGNVRLINGLKKVLRPFPALLKRARNRGSALVKAGAFTPEAALRSLETSLRELGSDYIDIFLLHEGSIADASGGALLEALLREVEKGKIRHLGVGSEFQKFQRNADLLPARYEVLQFNDNVLDQNVGKLSHRDDRFLITHSIFVPLKILFQAAKEHVQIVREHSLHMNIDLAEPSALGSLVLQFALWTNENGIVLFSSTDPHHIAANARQAEAEPYDDVVMHHFIAFVNELLVASAEPIVPKNQTASGPA